MKLFRHQFALLQSVRRIVRLVGGFGAGKTVALVAWAIEITKVNHPLPTLVIEPTFSQITRVFLPTIRRVLDEAKIRHAWNESKKCFTFWVKRKVHTIWCSSATDPETVKGISCGAAAIDEYESCPFPIMSAVLSRLRDARAKKVQLALIGTLEGFGEWSDLVDKPDFDAEVILASTYENKTLSQEFIASLKNTMTEAEFREKVMGLRTPKTGVVYTRWDRTVHHGKPPTIQHGDDVEIWADFNVGKMAWCFAVWRRENGIEKAYVWRELVDENTDTLKHGILAKQEMAEELSRHYGRNVTEDEAADIAVVVCDASGNARNTASKSDVGILSGLGFRVWHPLSNPRVKDRVQSVQMALANGQLTIDMERAPYIARCIESQPYNKHGEPDKDPKRGLDHGSDAVGYGVYYRLPAQSYSANTVCYDEP